MSPNSNTQTLSFRCPYPACSWRALMDQLLVHLNSGTHASTPDILLRCFLDGCPKVFKGMDDVLAHLNSASEEHADVLLSKGQKANQGAPDSVDIELQQTENPLKIIQVQFNADSESSTLYSLSVNPDDSIQYNGTPHPQLGMVYPPCPFLKKIAGQSPKPYNACASCTNKRKRCSLHATSIRTSRTAPGTACTGCKVDKKQCQGGTPCNRCQRLGRPCFGDTTYRAAIESLCERLTSTDEKKIKKAIRDLKSIISIGNTERRSSNSRNRSRVSASRSNRYLTCLMENGVMKKLHAMNNEDPALVEIKVIIQEALVEEEEAKPEMLATGMDEPLNDQNVRTTENQTSDCLTPMDVLEAAIEELVLVSPMTPDSVVPSDLPKQFHSSNLGSIPSFRMPPLNIFIDGLSAILSMLASRFSNPELLSYTGLQTARTRHSKINTVNLNEVLRFIGQIALPRIPENLEPSEEIVRGIMILHSVVNNAR